jgi:hypothetical protein
VDPAARTYSLIRYVTANCNNFTSVDNGASSHPALPNETYTLPPELSFVLASSSARYALFIPPDPRILLAGADGSLLPSPTGNIVVQSVNGNFSATISVNNAGQVTF